ncbi:MAG TPA: DUF222 domain-containing protein [Acidimicrobiales bacterium]
MFGQVVTPEVVPVDRALDGLAGVDPAGLDDHTLGEALTDLRRVRARLDAIEARLVEAVDARRPWAGAGYRSTATWLAASDNTSLDDAHRRVRLARRLRTMPATTAALAAGDITAAHAERLASLNAPDTAGPFRDAEEVLVGQARTMRWADFTRACAYWRRNARDDAFDPDRSDHDHRHVGLHDGLRGTGLLTGELTPLAKATVRSALERIERELFDADWSAARADHGDATATAHLARTPRQRRHDALVEMAVRASAAPAGAKRPRPLITILAGYRAFEDVCELADGTVVSPRTVAGTLDDALIERIVFDGPSRVLDLGRARSFVGAARRAVEVRDRHCQGPGCHVPAHACEIDHIHRHSEGGPTIPENGRAHCGYHNRRREQPPPSTAPPPTAPPRTDGDGLARLELARKRIADRLQHDPYFG